MTDLPFDGRFALVVEDEPFTCKVLAKMLARLGFSTVHQANDGGAGLDVVRTQPLDVVLCDIEMAPVDGLAFQKTVRAEGHLALPVLFTTNRIDDARAADARSLGADTFLTKPPAPDRLQAALSRMLGGAG